MYSDPTFELINQNVAKQVMSMEQLLQNLPEDFEILMISFPPGQPVDEKIYFAVEQLKCYFVSWRGETIDQLARQLNYDKASKDGRPRTEQQKRELELMIYDYMTPV